VEQALSELKKALDRAKPIEHKRVIAYLKALAEEKLAQHHRYLVTENMYEGLAGEIGSDFLLERNLLEFAADVVQNDMDQRCSEEKPESKSWFDNGQAIVDACRAGEFNKPVHFAFALRGLPFGTPCGANAGLMTTLLTEDRESVTCEVCKANFNATHFKVGHDADYHAMSCGLEVPDEDDTISWTTLRDSGEATCTICLASMKNRRKGPSKGWEHRKDLTKYEKKEELSELLEASKRHPDFDPRDSQTSTQPLPPSVWVNYKEKK
jgi:hypothetical protein